MHLPQWGGGAKRSGVIAVAEAVEACGLDSVWVADHLVFPSRSESTYPYRPDGLPFSAADGFLEAFTTLAVVAGATSRVALGTSVLVMPMRDPLTTAKIVATLDVLSEGRTLVAMGAGWWREEFAALGQQFDRRGRRFDEQLAILRAAWHNGTVEFDGEFYTLEEVACLPLPAQPGGPRVLVGGMGSSAHRRVARLGSGWHAVGSDMQALREGRARIDELAVEYGRDPRTIMLSTSAGLSLDDDRAITRLREFAEVGVDHLVLNLPGEPDDVVCRAEHIAKVVLPAAKEG